MTYLEAPSPPKDQVAQRYAHVLVDHLAVSLRRVVVPEHLHWTDNLNTRGVDGDDDNALLLVCARIVRVGLAEDEVEFAAWVAGAGNPPKGGGCLGRGREEEGKEVLTICVR